jgi:hypothetical protein
MYKTAHLHKKYIREKGGDAYKASFRRRFQYILGFWLIQYIFNVPKSSKNDGSFPAIQ